MSDVKHIRNGVDENGNDGPTGSVHAVSDEDFRALVKRPDIREATSAEIDKENKRQSEYKDFLKTGKVTAEIADSAAVTAAKAINDGPKQGDNTDSAFVKAKAINDGPKQQGGR